MACDPDLRDALRKAVGRRHVLTGRSATRRFRHGYRYGRGDAGLVVRPGSLVELWTVARLLVEADVSIIMQAANTGLTGGSTPAECGYPGGVAIVSTTRIRGLHLLGGGRQVVCLPGTTPVRSGMRSEADRPRTAFGDRVVLHRRIGHWRRLQQLGRGAGAARPGLLPSWRCSGE